MRKGSNYNLNTEKLHLKDNPLWRNNYPSAK